MRTNIFQRLFGLLIGLCLAASVQAQTPSYKIFNDSDFVLHFDTLDPGRGTWKPQVLNPHQGTQYSIMSGASTAKIRISTPNRGYVEYDIGDGGIYNLRWDKRKNMWDVKADRQANKRQNATPYGNAASNAGQNAGYAMPYRLGDAVQVLWKGRWYAATVIQIGQNKVKIHYDGYGNNWDEWVGSNRIRYR